MKRTSSAAADTLESVIGQLEGELIVELDSGKKQALSALESSKREARAIVEKILDTGNKQAETLKRQLIGAAELEARNAHLKTLEKAVSEVFEVAVKELHDLPASRYEKSLSVLLGEGVEVLGQNIRVYCNTRDRKAVSTAIDILDARQSRLRLDDKAIDTIGGVVMTSTDGLVRFDNTFEARLERMKPTLRMDVSAALSSS